MRIGLISDVHANLDALARALDLLERAGVDKLVCLGDVVEKGPEPDRVVERLDALAVVTVQGNHDANAVRHAELEPRRCGYASDTVAWLAALPRTREYVWADRHVALAHSSLAPDDWSGVRPGAMSKPMRRRLRSSDADVVALGHTHIPMWTSVAASGREVWLANPGSTHAGRCPLGPTCAVLSLPDVRLEVYSLQSGARVRLRGCG